MCNQRRNQWPRASRRSPGRERANNMNTAHTHLRGPRHPWTRRGRAAGHSLSAPLSDCFAGECNGRNRPSEAGGKVRPLSTSRARRPGGKRPQASALSPAVFRISATDHAPLKGHSPAKQFRATAQHSCQQTHVSSCTGQPVRNTGPDMMAGSNWSAILRCKAPSPVRKSVARVAQGLLAFRHGVHAPRKRGSYPCPAILPSNCRACLRSTTRSWPGVFLREGHDG